MSKVCNLPKFSNMNVFHITTRDYVPWDTVVQICSSPDFEKEGVGAYYSSSRNIVSAKFGMVEYVKEFFEKEGIDFDKFNGLSPTRINSYKAYEFSTLWLWSLMITIIKDYEYVKDIVEKDNFYTKYAKVISSVFKKYPKLTGILISMIDLKIPDNQFLDYAKMDEADIDSDHTDEFHDDSKANAFKDWLMGWYGKATNHDKMRVRNWFETGKSHKQILSEIRRVTGNVHKFNSRLSAFIERLLNHDDLENFMSKSGYPNKEEMFMAYFETIKDFDEDTKRSFIKKYLV